RVLSPSAAAAVVAVAYAATLIAAFSYGRASSLIGKGDLVGAIPARESAIAKEPGLALYRRQRGELYYVLGDWPSATRDLGAATAINTSDDLAWRALALSLRASGRDR